MRLVRSQSWCHLPRIRQPVSRRGGYTKKATENGDPFASAADCIAYNAANPGKLVSCTRVGTSGDDSLANAAAGEVVCGFGGADSMGRIQNASGGGVYDGGGADSVNVVGSGGTFNGGDGDDSVFLLDSGGTFNGGDGNDRVTDVRGTFNGGNGDDLANDIVSAVGVLATYDGGPDTDTLCNSGGGTSVVNVEVFACT